MNWTEQQRSALSAASEWVATGRSQVFRLFGFAGTGKTTLAKHLAEGISGTVLFAAFTGKAAHVMRRAGCEDASTIHSLIYVPKQKCRERLRELREMLAGMEPDDPRRPEVERDIEAERRRVASPSWVLNEDSILRDAELLVVDECSMVSERMAQDILSFGCRVLALGDPAQLPPVKGGGYFTTGEPDAFLTEIHRQARDNPIIDLATRVRQGDVLRYGRYGSSEVVRRGRLGPADVAPEDQVIVGRNATRARANRGIRRRRWGEDVGPLPVIGDRLVCLRNDHERGIMNGSVWSVLEFRRDPDRPVGFAYLQPDDGGARVGSDIYLSGFLGQGEDEGRDAGSFDFGFALTAHKSQGSQWPSVVVVDESAVFGRDRDRWLYTAITRAQEKVVIVR